MYVNRNGLPFITGSLLPGDTQITESQYNTLVQANNATYATFLDGISQTERSRDQAMNASANTVRGKLVALGLTNDEVDALLA